MSATSAIGTANSMPSLTVGDDGKVHVGGLVNNLDTDSIVNALMHAAAVPQAKLQARLAAETTVISAYKNLNDFLSTLATTAKADAGGGLNLLTVSSTDKSVTATAGTTAAATALTLNVDKIAQSQVSVTRPMTGWPTPNAAVTIVDATGVATAIAAKSADLHDIAAAINAAGKGVVATVVAAGKDEDGTALSRLQLSSKTAGAAGAFRLYAGTDADVRAGTAATAIASTLSTAQDAQLTLYPGTSSAQVVTSSGNTFKDLLPGLDVTVSAPTASAVTLTSSIDAKSVGSAASALVAAVTQIVRFIDTNSKDQTKTNADGSIATTPASFAGDTTVSAFRTQIVKAVSAPLGAGATMSPARYGVTLNADGTVDVDASALAAAVAADPTGTLAAVQQISTRIAEIATKASDAQLGSLTTSIAAKQKVIDADRNGIDAWTVRLAQQRTRLENQYAALVRTLGQLQNMQAYLSQQFDAMFTSK